MLTFHHFELVFRFLLRLMIILLLTRAVVGNMGHGTDLSHQRLTNLVKVCQERLQSGLVTLNISKMLHGCTKLHDISL